MTQASWLEAHPYLRSVAELSELVDRTIDQLDVAHAAIPSWDDYRPDFVAGVPLLSSADAAVDVTPGGQLAAALVDRLASPPSPPWLVTDARAISVELRDAPAAHCIEDVLAGDLPRESQNPGLLRYLAWAATARFLRPVVEAFDRCRDEDRWGRPYCPTCGSLPAMAQLTGGETGRKRLLACGCCRTRWQFKRTGCPFCEADTQQMASVVIEDEGGLRIDHCASCRGYLKTYDGQGHESLFLADWSSLHLDVVAHDRGLKRLAASLYAFEVAPST